MNIKAIIAALVLGSSSVALAAPTPGVTVSAKVSFGGGIEVRDHRTPAAPAAPIVRDHRHETETQWVNTVHPIRYQPERPVYQPVVYQPTYQRWATIASGINFGTDGRAFISMANQGAFRTLKLDAPRGGMVVREVAIEFADKSTQVLRGLNRVVDQNHPLTIDLDGNLRTVNRVIVYGPKGNTNPGFYGSSEVTLSAM